MKPTNWKSSLLEISFRWRLYGSPARLWTGREARVDDDQDQEEFARNGGRNHSQPAGEPTREESTGDLAASMRTLSDSTS